MPEIKRRIACSFGFIGLSILIFLCPCLLPQGKGAKKEASHKNQPSYGVKVNSVVINASVTDKSGNPVMDLTAQDFKLYDDGKPQQIQTFALESIDPAESEAVKVPGTAPAPKPAATRQNAPRPRLISIVIDDLTMESPSGVNRRPGSVEDYPRMVDAVKKFVKTDLVETDQVAILSGSRNVQYPFTDNKQRLFEELDTLPGKLSNYWPVRPDDIIMQDYLAWMYANDYNVDPLLQLHQKDGEWIKTIAVRQNADVQSRTRNLLFTIRQHLRALRHFDGAKMIVLFSDGFIAQIGRRTGAVEAHQLQELVDLALHSGIIVNTVSTRNLTAESADSDSVVQPASDIGREGENIVTGIPDEMDRLMQEKPMEQIASETGGQFFTRSNNMYMGLKSIAHRRHSYYILTYAMPPHKANGDYHHIKLEVTRPGLELSYRKGYYSPDEEVTFENSKKEDLMEALNGPGNMNEIPMSLSYNFFQEDESRYAVSFITNVNIRGLQFPEEDDRRRNQISLVLVALDETDHFISGLEKAIDFRLLENSYAGLRERGLTSRVELRLPIGRYKIKAVVRENAQGKIGSITKSVEIP